MLPAVLKSADFLLRQADTLACQFFQGARRAAITVQKGCIAAKW